MKRRSGLTTLLIFLEEKQPWDCQESCVRGHSDADGGRIWQSEPMHLLIIFVCGLLLFGALKGWPARRANVVELEYWTTRIMEQGAVIEALIQEAMNDLGVDLMDTDVNWTVLSTGC